MKRPALSLLVAAMTVGLAIGWVAGSWAPWSLVALVIGMVLAGAWLVWGHLSLQRDMRELEELKSRILTADEE